MAGDLGERIANLARAVRQGRGAVLMDLDGVAIERATALPGADAADLEAVAGEYAGPLRHARSLVRDLNLGPPRSFSVRGAAGAVVFAFAPKDLVLGVQAGPTGVGGQMRYVLSRTLAHIGDL